MGAVHRIERSSYCLGCSLERCLGTGNTVSGIDRIDGRLHGMHRSMDRVFSNTEGPGIQLNFMDKKVVFWNSFGSFYYTYLGTVSNF